MGLQSHYTLLQATLLTLIKTKRSGDFVVAIVESNTTLVLYPELAGTRITPAEFDAAEQLDEWHNYELVRGVLVVTPPVSEGERGPNDELGYLLRVYRDSHPKGAALNETLPEHLIRTPHSRRRADRVIWAGLGRKPNFVRDLPQIAIEFVSEGKRSFQRDYDDKREEYLAAGLVEYWIIDRFRRVMTVVRAGRRKPKEILVHEHEAYQTPLLPGFELPLTKLLTVADEMEQSRSSDPLESNDD